MATVDELVKSKKSTIENAMGQKRFGISVRTALLGVESLNNRQKNIETKKPLPAWLNGALNRINPKKNEKNEPIRVVYTRPSLGGNLQKGLNGFGKRILNNIVTSQTKNVLMDETDYEIARNYAHLTGDDRSGMREDVADKLAEEYKDQIDKLALASARKTHQIQYEAEHPEEIEQAVNVQPAISTPQADDHSRFMHPTVRTEAVATDAVPAPTDAVVEEASPAHDEVAEEEVEETDLTTEEPENDAPVYQVIDPASGSTVNVKGNSIYTFDEWGKTIRGLASKSSEELQDYKAERARLRAEYGNEKGEDPAFEIIMDNAKDIRESYLRAIDFLNDKLTQQEIAQEPLTHHFIRTIELYENNRAHPNVVKQNAGVGVDLGAVAQMVHNIRAFNASAEADAMPVVINIETGQPMAVQGTGLYSIQEWEEVLDYWSDLTPEELQARKKEVAEQHAEYGLDQDPSMNLVIDNASSIRTAYAMAANRAHGVVKGELKAEEVNLNNQPLAHYFYDTVALGLQNKKVVISLDSVASLAKDILDAQAQVDAQLALEEAATDFIVTENGKLQEVPASEEISLETHEQVILGANEDGSPRYVWRLREEAPKVEAENEVELSAVDLMKDHEFTVTGANEDGSPQYDWKLREEAPKAEAAKPAEELSVMDLMHTHDYVVTGANEDGSPQYEWRLSEKPADISKLSLEELARTHNYIVTGVNDDGSAQYEWVPNGQTAAKTVTAAPAIKEPNVAQTVEAKPQDIVAEAEAIATAAKVEQESDETPVTENEPEEVMAKLSVEPEVLTARLVGQSEVTDRFADNTVQIVNAHNGSTWQATTTLSNYFGSNKKQHPTIVYSMR